MSDGTKKRETWLGGYVRHGKNGPTYVIERWIGGVHFHKSTRCRTERAALKQLEKFEASPINYSPTEEVERLRLTPELILEYRDWMMTRRRNPTSKDWAFQCASFLTDWMEDFGGKDLRHVDLFRDLKPAVAKRRSQGQRVEAIKAFYSWLRKERGLVRRGEDPTLDFPVPHVDAAQTRKPKAVEPDRVGKVLRFLSAEARDVLIMLSGTGWHISEVRRFALNGEIYKNVPNCLAVVVTRHKVGKRPHATRLTSQVHLEAAERIRERGAIPSKETLVEEMKQACTAAGVPQFRMGVMRHTVATSAVASGESIKDVSEFLGHSNVRTTLIHYVDHRAAVSAVTTFDPTKDEPEPVH